MEGNDIDLDRDFPNRRLCWFLLRDPVFQALTPGQLVVGLVQPSDEHGSPRPDKDWWQIRVDSAQLAGSSDSIIEVVEAGAGNSEDPRLLLEPGYALTLDHRPSTLVLVSLGDWIYGPFRTRVPRTGPDNYNRWQVSLERTSRPVVYKLPRSRAEQANAIVRPPKVSVSLESQPPDKAAGLTSLAYTFMPWASFERLRQLGATEIEIRTDAEVLLRAAADHLRPRAKRQLLRQLLDELGTSLNSAQSQDAMAGRTTLARLEASISASDRLADELAQALLQSGAIEERIEALKEERFTAHLEQRAAEVEARIAERVRSKAAEFEAIEKQVENFKERIEIERAAERARTEEELSARRAAAEAELKAETEKLAGEIAALKREQETLVATMERAADRFTSGRSEFVADLVALLPALAATGVMPSPAQPAAAASPPAPSLEPRVAAPLPAAFLARHPAPAERMSEAAFLERFLRHVEGSGFRYRDHDLKAFHLSIKCSDLTVLAGLSGIGKSSLVGLYAEALAGEDQAGQARLLTVDVSPSWTEPQDLLGSVNLLDRRFEPAANGLFNHLVAAAQEHQKAGSHAGMVLVALDEMNLAQVEHYFAGFMQGLERDPPRREIAVLDASALRPDDPLRGFARVPLPPTLRFVGTVNFDETTRPLSQRLKDRAAILEIIGDRHAGRHHGATPRPVPAGPPVLLSDIQSWLGREKAMPVEVATFLDALNPPLLRLGCPITSRRMAAIYRLLAASTSIMSIEQALDIAVASRVLPMLRHLGSLAALQEASRLQDLLAAAPGGCTDSARFLRALRDEAEADLAAGLEDA
jgi:energy-coupling factor transporter ATP-binding protein EcfA2